MQQQDGRTVREAVRPVCGEVTGGPAVYVDGLASDGYRRHAASEVVSSTFEVMTFPA